MHLYIFCVSLCNDVLMMFYAGMLGLIWAYKHYNERDRERVKENIWAKALKDSGRMLVNNIDSITIIHQMTFTNTAFHRPNRS